MHLHASLFEQMETCLRHNSTPAAHRGKYRSHGCTTNARSHTSAFNNARVVIIMIIIVTTNRNATPNVRNTQSNTKRKSILKCSSFAATPEHQNMLNNWNISRTQTKSTNTQSRHAAITINYITAQYWTNWNYSSSHYSNHHFIFLSFVLLQSSFLFIQLTPFIF
jgi:hypothetical protein